MLISVWPTQVADALVPNQVFYQAEPLPEHKKAVGHPLSAVLI
jgi:hypothetical protein